MGDLISVIVPIYKVEEYLVECINSIIHQTYTNLEIILVDDGSPDRCPLICDDFAKQDSRIKVIHKKNGGLSDARNVGIDASNGKYLVFIDSDDFIDIDMIEKLYDTIIKKNADMAICNISIFDDDTKFHTDDNIAMENALFSNMQMIENLIGHSKWFYVVAWNKIYTKEIWNNVRYPKGFYHEDQAVIHNLFFASKKIATINDKLYNYRQRKESITKSKSTYFKRITDYYLIISERIIFLKSIISKEELKKHILYNYLSTYKNDFFEIYENSENKYYIYKMKKSLLKILPTLYFKADFGWKYCLLLILFLINPKYATKWI